MEFLKNFFNDDSVIIGLSNFNLNKAERKNYIEKQKILNPFKTTKTIAFRYETNLSNNLLL